MTSLLAGLRSLETVGRRRAVWGGISLLALLGSGLCYEAAVPVFILNALLFARRRARTVAALTALAVGEGDPVGRFDSCCPAARRELLGDLEGGGLADWEGAGGRAATGARGSRGHRAGPSDLSLHHRCCVPAPG